MRVVVPLRYNDLMSKLVNCDSEFDRLVNELPIFNGDKRLINLIDNSGREETIYLIDIKFTFVDLTNPLIKKLGRNHQYFLSPDIKKYLVIDFILNHQITGYDSLYRIWSDLYIKKLALLINLVYGIPLTILPGVVYNGNEFMGATNFAINSLDFSYEHAAKIKWPKLEALDFDYTLEWFNKYNINLYTRSNNPASRAINAFSNLINDSNLESDASHLFWCMLGIEALYCVGNSNILEQFRQKSSIVLGEPKEYKKKLVMLYDYRSRLVHGNLDFPPRFQSDVDTQVDEFNMEYYDYCAFSSSILIASIRALIYNDIERFTFDFYWSNKKEGNNSLL